MSKKYLIPILIIMLAVASVFVISRSEAKKSGDKIIKKEKIKIATCPTYYDILSSLDGEEYEVIKTDSSSASLYLLGEFMVDYVLSGRPLKPGEGIFQREYIAKNGYSFVGNEERVINKDSLNSEVICTDIDRHEVEINFNLLATQVDNIKECPQEAIVVTSWDNTNYEEVSPIHVINSDGSRHFLSRTPIVYCQEECPEKIINQIKMAYEK